MKFIKNNNKLILFLYKELITCNLKNQQALEKYLKEQVINIKKIYKVKIEGCYDVYLYYNRKYGLIIEFIKISSLEYFPDLIDLNIKLIYDSKMFLEVDDYFLIKKYKEVYYFNDKYYLNVDNLLNLDSVILSDFSKIIYGKSLEQLLPKLSLLL